MRRILLVIEDHNELVFLETFLKKLGFDCASHRTEIGLTDFMLGFPPDIIVVQAQGKKLNGFRVSAQIKKKNKNIKVVLLTSRGKPLDKNEIRNAGADSIVESPVQPRTFIEIMGRLAGVDGAQLLQKFDKLDIGMGGDRSGNVHVKGSALQGPAAIHVTGGLRVDNGARGERYKKLASEEPMPSMSIGFSRKTVEDQVKEFREREKSEDTKILEEQRKAFIRAMFKK